MIIYKITNTLTGLAYIGQTNRTIEDRWKEHCKPALKTRSYLSNAIQKYGKQNFKIELLQRAKTQSELDKLEENFIQLNNTIYPTGYNLRAGGKGGKLSKEAKDKLKKKNLGKRLNYETRTKISKANKGKEAVHVRPVIGTNIKTGETIELKHANAIPEKFHYNCIHRCAKGERKSHKGFAWKYK